MIKGSIHHKDMTVIHLYLPHNRVQKYNERKNDRNEGKNRQCNTNSQRFNTPVFIMDRPNKQNISKKIEDLHSILNKVDLTDICRTLHPKTAKYTLFSSAQGTFSLIDNM